MSDTDRFDRQRNIVTDRAKQQGYTLLTHMHFSLRRDSDGDITVDRAETLSEVNQFLGGAPLPD
jgi:hypothetical protein